MMTGRVTADREALIRLLLRGANGLDVGLEFVIDTGFTEYLSPPQSWIDALAFPLMRTDDIYLADNTIIQTAIYQGVIVWDGQEIQVEIHRMEGSLLIGISLMYNYLLNLPIRTEKR